MLFGHLLGHPLRERTAERPVPDGDDLSSRPRRAARLVERDVDLGERHPRACQQRRPGRRELDVPRGPDEQDGPDVALQLPDRARQRRLRHVQALRRAAEVKLLGDRHEVPQLPQLDRRIHRPDPLARRSRAAT